MYMQLYTTWVPVGEDHEELGMGLCAVHITVLWFFQVSVELHYNVCTRITNVYRIINKQISNKMQLAS